MFNSTITQVVNEHYTFQVKMKEYCLLIHITKTNFEGEDGKYRYISSFYSKLSLFIYLKKSFNFLCIVGLS
jgi:hypothetical protein